MIGGVNGLINEYLRTNRVKLWAIVHSIAACGRWLIRRGDIKKFIYTCKIVFTEEIGKVSILPRVLGNKEMWILLFSWLIRIH